MPPYTKYFMRRSAMTLVEMMIAMTIGVTILGLATGTTVDLYKNFAAAEAYRNVHKEARRSLEFLSRDIRASSNLNSWSTNNITLAVMNITGLYDQVTYQLVNNDLQRTVSNSAGISITNLLTEHVTQIVFEPWTNPGVYSTNSAGVVDPAKAYEIRASLFITNTTYFRISSDMLQTRAKMRNKP